MLDREWEGSNPRLQAILLCDPSPDDSRLLEVIAKDLFRVLTKLP